MYDAFIEELHIGAKTLIYYFHYCNKGSYPFRKEWVSGENIELAQLNREQVQFLLNTAEQVGKRRLLFPATSLPFTDSGFQAPNLNPLRKATPMRMIFISWRSFTTRIGDQNLRCDDLFSLSVVSYVVCPISWLSFTSRLEEPIFMTWCISFFFFFFFLSLFWDIVLYVYYLA